MWNWSSSLFLVALSVSGAERIEAWRTVMGTQFRITVYADDVVTARAAIDRAFERGIELDSKLSDYIPDSELNQLCRSRRTQVSADLYRVLEYSQRVAGESDGAFDVTLGPLTRLWRESRRSGVLPSAETLREAKSRCGYRSLKLGPNRTVHFRKPGMQLDLGGIAKGYAADEMLSVLRSAGFPRALVAASGDLAIGDPPPDRAGWRVELGATGEVRELRNCAVSTAGDAEQYVVIGGVRYSHIVDPHTGLGFRKSAMVTVIAPTGLEADALDTAIYASKDSRRIMWRHPKVEVLPKERATPSAPHPPQP